MHLYYLLTVLLMLITLFSLINYKWLKLPGPIAITLLSLCTAVLLLMFKNVFPELASTATETLSTVHFYDIVLQIVLGFILFAGAYRSSYREIKTVLKPVILLATLGTIISTILVGVLMQLTMKWFGLHVPLIYCFLFGALISPTDPIAALGILQKAGISRSLQLKLTGESLINDAVGIVLFVTCYDIFTSGQGFVLTDVVLLFLREAGGGLLFGLLLGGVGFFLLHITNSYKIAILVTLMVVTAGYTAAQMIHVSGPIAMVTAGLIMGNAGRNRAMDPNTTKITDIFWKLSDNFFNSMLFLLIGFELLLIVPPFYIIVVGLITVVVVLLSRFLAVLLPALVLRRELGSGSLVLLTWCAMRGAVSIALALALPTSSYHDLFLTLTYFVCIFSIVVQGLTIKPLAKFIAPKVQDS
jgi:CPA1 family monovalent cation:H+ antiporter